MILYWIFIGLLTFILLIYIFLIYYHNNIAIKPIRKKYTRAYIFLWIIEFLILIWFILPFLPKISLKPIRNNTNSNTTKTNNDIEFNEMKEETEDNSTQENNMNTEESKEEDTWWFSTIINAIFNNSAEEEKDYLAFSEENCERWIVDRITDWDTIVVKWEPIRLIWINTPETVDPNKPIQCYWPESLERMKKLVSNKRVCLIKDTISPDFDKRGRKLRYVYLESWKSANEIMLEESFSREYSKYDFWLKEKYKAIADIAKESWTWVYNCPIELEDEDEDTSEDIKKIEEPINETIGITNNEPIKEFVINEQTNTTNRANCKIKWNINDKWEKIYHLPWCEYYERTDINRPWEKRFCTEEEARAAWWRKAKNC